MKRHLAGRHIHRSMLQIPTAQQLRLPRFDAFKRNTDMAKQPLALLRQLHPPIVTDEQRAAQLPFQRLNHPRQVRLIAQQHFRRLRHVAVLGHVIKNPIIIIADVHAVCHPKFI